MQVELSWDLKIDNTEFQDEEAIAHQVEQLFSQAQIKREPFHRA